MEFPKRLYVVLGDGGDPFAGEGLAGLPPVLLPDGAEVGVYLFRRKKRIEVTRKLVKMNAADPDEDEEQTVLPLAGQE